MVKHHHSLSTGAMFVLALACCGAVRSQQMESSFEAARLASTAQSKPILAIVTGSDWDATSRVIAEEQLVQRRFQDAYASKFVLMHLDLRIRSKGDEEAKARDRAVGSILQIGVWREEQVPCAVLVDLKGEVRGRTFLAGTKLDQTLASIGDMVSAFEAVAGKASDPASAQRRMATAQALFQQKKVHEARAEVLAAAKEDPGNPDCWDLLAVTAGTVAKPMEVREWMAALAAAPERLGAAADPSPNQAIRWARLGDALAAARREQEALFCYRQSMAMDPASVVGGLKAGALAWKRKESADALRDVNEVLRREFALPEALQLRAKILPPRLLEGY